MNNRLQHLIAEGRREQKTQTLSWVEYHIEPMTWCQNLAEHQALRDYLLAQRTKSQPIVLVKIYGADIWSDIPPMPVEQLIRALLEAHIFVELPGGYIYYESAEYQALYRELFRQLDNPPDGEEPEDLDELYSREANTPLSSYRQKMEDLRMAMHKVRNPYLHFGILSDLELQALKIGLHL